MKTKILADFQVCNSVPLNKRLYKFIRAYSGHLLGATIAPNLVPLVLRKIFLLEIVKNDICLGGTSEQNAFFSEKCTLKTHPRPHCLE